VQHGEQVSGATRDLTVAERELLNAMLQVDGLEDGEALRRQAATARAASSCGCGCGSISLVVTDGGPSESWAKVSLPAVEGDVLGGDSELIGGLLLFQRDGWLCDLEVNSFIDEPLPLPAVDSARLRRYRDAG